MALMTPMTRDADDGSDIRMGRFCAFSDLIPADVLEWDGNGLPFDLLETSWAEVVGPDLGAITRPLRIKHGTASRIASRLYLETPGSCAQMVSMCSADIIDRVNSVCGYAAVQKISIVQTNHAEFIRHQPRTSNRTAPSVQVVDQCERMLASLEAGDLRDELMKLCISVMQAESAGTQDQEESCK